jgi:rhizosphere induced protein
MADTYSLTVINDSHLTQTFAIFTTLPVSGTYGSLSMAWNTQIIDPGNRYLFEWDIAWGLACTNHGTTAGTRWTGTSTLPVDPRTATGSGARLTYDGDYSLRPDVGPGTGDTLVVTDDPNLPIPPAGSQEASCSVAVTLDGDAVCAVDAGRNLKQTFTLTPTYFIDAGTYEKGQMVSGASLTGFEPLPFLDGIPQLAAVLTEDNTWKVGSVVPLD